LIGLEEPIANAGKLIKGKKRHILVDTLGLLLHAIVHSAGIQDRDGGTSVAGDAVPFLEKLFADSAYQGPIFANALTKILPRLETEVVKRSDHAKEIRAISQALYRRTYDCVPQSLPPPRQGLGKSQPQRRRVLETRLHPPHVAKAL
jgi:Transposase DDE domain